MKLLNAFTPAMLPGFPGHAEFRELGVEEVKSLLAAQGVESCVGHAGSAEMFSALLGAEVPVNRVSVKLDNGEVAVVGQYLGPRLPEGSVLSAKELAAAPFRWLRVTAWTGTVADAAAVLACHQ